jgi:hypothetical protein
MFQGSGAEVLFSIGLGGLTMLCNVKEVLRLPVLCFSSQPFFQVWRGGGVSCRSRSDISFSHYLGHLAETTFSF